MVTKLQPAALEPFRRELVAHCYRMLGSLADAEDMTQDTMARAAEGLARFDGRSTIRTWLYRIATNRCLDELKSGRRRRELPVGSGLPIDADDAAPAAEPARWIDPFPGPDPEAQVGSLETIRLAFVAALQQLSPHQRAVLLLRDVLGWSAAEVADALDVTVAAVNSALHRARALAGDRRAASEPPDAALLERYVQAWVRGDAAALARLLTEDATFSMPPNPAWLRGRDAVRRYLERVVMTPDTVRRLLPTRANGAPAFGVYVRRGADFVPHSLHVLEIVDGAIADIVSFHGVAFDAFGLPS